MSVTITTQVAASGSICSGAFLLIFFPLMTLIIKNFFAKNGEIGLYGFYNKFTSSSCFFSMFGGGEDKKTDFPNIYAS